MCVLPFVYESLNVYVRGKNICVYVWEAKYNKNTIQKKVVYESDFWQPKKSNYFIRLLYKSLCSQCVFHIICNGCLYLRRQQY